MKLISKDFLKFAAAPLFMTAVFVTVYVSFSVFSLPDKPEIIRWLKVYYDQYGYWLVFAGAIGEGLLVLNWYFPGSIAIVFGVVFARPDPVKAIIMVALVIVGFFLTTLFNYAMGKYGWYRLLLYFGLRGPLENVKQRVETKGLPLIFFTYLHPNLGALTATSIGILHLPFKPFVGYSILALVVWNTIWGFVAYFSGPKLLDLLGFYLVFGLLILWFVYLAVRYSRRNEESHQIT